MVEQLHTLLVNARVEGPYMMVGLSFGGALTRLYTHKYPDEIKVVVLVDAAPDELFIRVPKWDNAIDGKAGLFRTLAPLSSFGLLAFVSESIPNRGISNDVLAKYRAIAVSTGYFRTVIGESEAFETNLAEVRAKNANYGWSATDCDQPCLLGTDTWI